ncbi:CRISPR-associated exonuclease, Cas4 family [Chitinophaga rupis]|uniref:CRISPR-associated exonuclease Cas4 n=1 Tax=Chitinophaga rupis TaxID=573321 RepID=A0A1H7YSV1_9BACT|nr:CRISPR-associated protein Cas4 [Chitinophaga rupis]SEM48427.1 CRISPR-associated exonuclease, Cas4 family [Chitinophaga rupis]
MQLTATHINYYHVCHRKLWLFTNGINMEHTSDTVYDGKLLHETSYPQRAERYTEIDISATTAEGIQLTGKIDFYDTKEKIIHEIKRSNKVEEAHEWQVKYYIWLLELNDISGVYAILEYPKLRQTKEVWLSEPDTIYLQETVHRVVALQQSEECPPKISSNICKSCSYYDLCYVEET